MRNPITSEDRFFKIERQRAYDEWANRECPSGDVTEVGEKWESSSELREHLEWAEKTAEAMNRQEVIPDGENQVLNADKRCEMLTLALSDAIMTVDRIGRTIAELTACTETEGSSIPGAKIDEWISVLTEHGFIGP